jgi:hypothetical protein
MQIKIIFITNKMLFCLCDLKIARLICFYICKIYVVFLSFLIDLNRNFSSSNLQNISLNTNSSDKHSFTMKREFERAKEEADLIKQLRNVSITFKIKEFLLRIKVNIILINLIVYFIAHRNKIKNGSS